jgi:hypothetical protein
VHKSAGFVQSATILQREKFDQGCFKMAARITLKTIAARVGALRQAMEAVRQGTTPDHAKWSATRHFVSMYSELAQQYNLIATDDSVRVYDVSKIKDWADTVWPMQKGLFDTTYADTLTLESLVAGAESSKLGPIYNLLVSGLIESWTGEPIQLEIARCVREYTNPLLTQQFGTLDSSSISELKRAPCIFAYETGLGLPPKFGYLTDVVQRQGEVRLKYQLRPIEPFLSHTQLNDLKFELDISKNELHRTHWAVKEVDLAKALHSHGINLPSSMRDVANTVEVSTHVFDVALSFPGEVRPIVDEISQELERRLGPNTYFYDNNYVSQLAQPSLDTLLQGVYSRATLDVVFLSADYQRKDWCGVEFRAIREIMLNRQNERVMFVRTDDGEVAGVFKTDGYVDARKYKPDEIANFICERVNILKRNRNAD